LDQKEQYYVSVAQGKISQIPNAQDNDFAIMATKREMNQLRKIFDNMDFADNRSHFRAAMPFIPYSHDQPNDDYDHYITKAYELIYELGDDEARENIEQSGILSHRPIQTTGELSESD